MRYLIDSQRAVADGQQSLAIADELYQIRVTPAYKELSIVVDEQHAVYVNLIQRDETSVYVAGLLNQDFSALKNPASDFAKWVGKHCPTLAMLYTDGLNGKYRNFALIELYDADYGEKVWCLATVIGNLEDPSHPETYAPLIRERVELLFSRFASLVAEVSQAPSQTYFRWKSMAMDAVLGVFKSLGDAVTDTAMSEAKTFLSHKTSEYVAKRLEG